MDRYESGPVLSATPPIALSDPGTGSWSAASVPRRRFCIRRCTRLRLIAAPCGGQSESRCIIGLPTSLLAEQINLATCTARRLS